MRALLEELDQAPGDVTVVHRVRSRPTMPCSPTSSPRSPRPGARATCSSRGRGCRTGTAGCRPRPATSATSQALREIVPDIADHDVYLCGADGWMSAARAAAIDAGVPHDAVHLERFAY